MRATLPLLENSDFPAVRRTKLETLQVNLGYLCNQSCTHCHVSAGPNRREIMTVATADVVVEFMERGAVSTLDLTGGAPEMNANFRRLVSAARALGIDVIDRCNLTILGELGYESLAEFLAENGVKVVASLPCYTEDLVDQQRGKGVYRESIDGLLKLNALGYGQADTGLILDLVYNPQGAVLPPPQQALEAQYKHELDSRFGVQFSNLLTLANLPVGRFGSVLQAKGKFDDYMQLLKNSHRIENVAAVMCRSMLSVDWQGYVFDCDFNQMLGLEMATEPGGRTHLKDLLHTCLEGRAITVRDHCFGCTAGQGSSCGGALESGKLASGLVA